MITTSMGTGGPQRYVSMLLEHLSRDAFALELATVFERDSRCPIPADVPAHVISAERSITPPLEIAWLPKATEGLTGDAEWIGNVVSQIAGLVERLAPDLVLTTPEWVSALVAAASVRFPSSTRVVCRIDAPPSVAFPRSGRSGLYGALIRQYGNRVDRFMAVSGAIANELETEFGVDASQVVVLPSFVDIAKVRALSEDPVAEMPLSDGIPSIVFTGRLDRVKGLAYLLRAVAKVLETTPVRCVLVGEGSQRGYLQALAKHLGIADRVHFVGRHANPFRFMSKATALVLPSLSEGMPTVLVEAMACGCPVIASDIRGGVTREILEDGGCGLIVPREDAFALAEAIEQIITDEALRARLVESGSECVAAFDLPIVLQRNIEVFEAVASADPASMRVDDIANRVSAVATAVASGSAGEAAGISLLRSLLTILRQRGPGVVIRHGLGRLRASARSAARTLGLRGAQSRRCRVSAVRRDSNRMRLVVLVPRMDDQSIGTGTSALLEHIDRSAFDLALVRVFAGEDGGHVPDDVERYVVEARGARQLDLAEDLPSDIASRYCAEIRWVAAAARGFGELASEWQADAVLAQGFFAGIVANAARAWLPERTSVLTGMHSRTQHFAGSAGNADLYGALLRVHLRSSDVVLAPVEAMRRDLVEGFGVSESRIVIMPDPVEVRRLGEGGQRAPHDSNGQRILEFIVPATTPNADLATVIHALALARKWEPIRCVFVGAGAPSQALRDTIGQLDLDGAVAFEPHARAFGPLLRRAAGCVCAVTRAEPGIPPAIVDSAAQGCPVIATRASDYVCEFLGEGERGVLVSAHDADAVAEGMLQLVWDEDFARGLADRARAYLKIASAEFAVPRIAGVIRDTTEGYAELPARG